MRHVEEKVEEILKELNINNAPVEPKKCAEHFGIDVKAVDLDKEVSGLFVLKGESPYIMYNKNETSQRKRFTIAHELGHFILHKNTSLFIDKSDRVLYRNSSSTTGEVLKEREANAFAACLLMPKKLIESEINNVPLGEDVVDYLSQKFKVSQLAMSFRLSNLGYEIGW
jgi:Zn-dependent peptidase ImmA (M78 family)